MRRVCGKIDATGCQGAADWLARHHWWSLCMPHGAFLEDQGPCLIKKQRHYLADKGLYSQSHGFPSGHVLMWELDYKGISVPKNWCFWTVVLEKTLESPLDCKETKPVNCKGNQSWIFIEGLTLKLQHFGHLMQRADSLEKTLMLGNIEGRRKRGDRGWDGWMASPSLWTWVWISSGSWWGTGKPGVL